MAGGAGRGHFSRMTTRTFLTMLAGALTVACCLPALAGTSADSPAALATAFCRAVRAERIEGLPTTSTMAKLRPLITRELADGIERARAEQVDFQRQHPDEKPPWIEGDLFSSSFEGVTSWSLGTPVVKEKSAEVPLHHVCADGKDTVRWTDTLVLTRTATGWRVADVRYGGAWAFKAGDASLARSLPPAP